MKEGSSTFAFGTYMTVVVGATILLGLYLTSLYSYLLFHSLSEIFSIVIAVGIFMIAWNTRRLLDNHYFLFLGIAYLFIGGMDLLHTLAYKGMGVFRGEDTDLPTQLWVSARYMESLSLLVAPLFVVRKLREGYTLMGYAGVTALTLSAIFYWEIFPVCYQEGEGLTTFKKGSEYVICAVLLCAAAFLIRKKKEFDSRVVALMVASILITLAAEMAFTFYVDVYGFFNLLGHMLKILSFYLVYKAIMETGLVEPYSLLFRDLKQKEEKVRASEERFRAIADYTYDWESWFGTDGRLLWVNPGVEPVTGYSPSECMAMHNFPFPLIHRDDRGRMRELIFNAFKERTTGADVRFRVLRKDGQTRWVAVSWQPIYSKEGECTGFRSSVHDISQRKKAEDAIQEAYGELENRVRERTAELEEANVRLRQQITERQRSEQALRQSQEDLRVMSARLLTAQEEERKMISRDLHDGIGQTLSALKFGIESAISQLLQGDLQKGVQSLEAASPMVGRAIEEVRRTQKGLRPPVLDDLGILPTFSWFCRECGELYSNIRIETQIAIEEDQVPQELKIVLFRVLQEAVNNAAKHATAELVRVTLIGNQSRIQLIVRDNGKGFDASTGDGQADRGTGLRSMRERVELSGGSFSIQSNKGSGTTVSATWLT